MTNHLNSTNYPNFFLGKKEMSAKSSTAWRASGFACLSVGLIVLIATGVLVVTEYFLGKDWQSVWLFFVALPLLMTGAHCLDKFDAFEKARKIADCEMLDGGKIIL